MKSLKPVPVAFAIALAGVAVDPPSQRKERLPTPGLRTTLAPSAMRFVFALWLVFGRLVLLLRRWRAEGRDMDFVGAERIDHAIAALLEPV
jgi:hypothetical protein